MVRRKTQQTKQKDKKDKSSKGRKYQKEIRIEPRTSGQEEYIKLIDSNDIIVCNGQAGTGKTLLAVGMALKLLKDNPNKYSRIIMVRPAITVKGEELGYLPGGIDDKMMPFMMPMLDSLKYFLMNSDVITLMELGIVEISPISHMRGRTFNNCLMIFDEAQNSTSAQMKMVVTRMGFNTKLIIEGDVSQSDLEYPIDNGLSDAMIRFADVKGVGVCSLGTKDVVRSPILTEIIKTYEYKVADKH